MAPGRPCSNCSFDPAQQQIPTVEELREVYLPHYEALRPQFNALHRELQGRVPSAQRIGIVKAYRGGKRIFLH